MAYTPTVWVNDSAPALSAANLNKLTNELESQAALIGLGHDLPNWINGSNPSLSNGQVLNEIERVLYEVATELGLSYTRTVWGDGWTPARNATNLNKIEQQAEANRDEIIANPPPPPPEPVGNIYLAWDRVSDIPDLHDGDNGRLTTVTLGSMPSGVSQVIRVSVTNAGDSSGGGDGSYGTTGNLHEPWITEGSETWTSFYYLIPDGNDGTYPGSWQHSVISSGWNTIHEYHEPGNIAPRSLHFAIWGSDPPVWQLTSAGGNTSAPTDVWVRGDQIQYNVWQRHLIHIKWSRANAGFIEWSIDGSPQVTRSSANLVPGPSIANNFPTAWNHNGSFVAPYFQAGHYRGPSVARTDTTYMAKIRVGSTMESVLA
jgi:hypothetical protein